MTAPAPRSGPDVAGRLAEVLAEALERLGLDDMTEHEDRLDVAQALLLPVVDEIAAARAAEELEAAADGFAYTPLSERESGQVSGYTRGWHNAADALRARAAALRGGGRG